jgi:DNA-binding GntR family transcriptional regulator
MTAALALVDVAPLDRVTLGDRAYAQIAELLIAGKLTPGDKLSLRSTAEALGVSMMPVREAVTRLVADGALENTPNRAVRVPTLTIAQFKELTSVRVAIEGHAAAEAARCRLDEDIPAAQAAELAFRDLRAVKQPDLALAVELNKDFHFALYAASQSPLLMGIIRSLWLKAGPVINLDLRANPDRIATTQAVEFHAQALRGLINGDPEEARAGITRDIQGAADFILSHGRLVGP